MTTVSLYDVVVPTLTKGLKTFDHILTKAEEYAQQNGLDANAVFPQARLIEDQNPLVFQVQNATRTVKVTLGRLTGIETAPYENNETSIQDLHARIQDALGLLETADAAAINGQADRIVELPFGGKVLKLSAQDAALSQGLPNFFFHLNTGYSILRAKGVPVGKADYIGSFLSL